MVPLKKGKINYFGIWYHHQELHIKGLVVDLPTISTFKSSEWGVDDLVFKTPTSVVGNVWTNSEGDINRLKLISEVNPPKVRSRQYITNPVSTEGLRRI